MCKHFVYISALFSIFGSISAQSIQEMQKLKSEYEKYKSLQVEGGQNENKPKDGGANLGDVPSEFVFGPYKSLNSDSLEGKIKHFGYDFFIKRDTLRFWENLPIPSNYTLGPGDEVIVSIWGQTQLRNSYTISRDGKIYDEKVGLLNLSDKTIAEGKKYLINQFGRVYSTLTSSNPSSYIDISLGEIRSINVNFVGECKFPGVYPVHPFSNIITGLIQAGGVDTTGTLRNISIKRDGKVVNKIDLYEYFLLGNLPSNIQLKDQDIIVIPTRLSTIVIDSSVVKPGIYEAKQNETIKDMIKYAGGLKFNASSEIGLERILPYAERLKRKINKENYYIDFSNSHLVAAQDGDKIIARYLFDEIKQVEIIGQVKKPAKYHFYNGMTIKDLLELSLGYNDTTFWKSIHHESGQLVRMDPLNSYEKVINFNIKDIMNGDDDINIELQNLDKIIIRANPNFVENENVQILGEVNIPGSYPLVSDRESLNSLLKRSGGLTSKALSDGISVFRKKKYFNEGIKKNKKNEYFPMLTSPENLPIKYEFKENEKDEWIRVAWQNTDLQLMPGDSVVIKEATGSINLRGEVYNPGLIEFQSGKSLRYYIDSAGGVTPAGNYKNTIVVYANGVIKPNKFLSTPSIKDGATIIVNKKEIKDSVNYAEIATSLLSIISTTVTILVLSQQISSAG